MQQLPTPPTSTTSRIPRIPREALVASHQASTPGCNVWVSANAGSGKTHVLTLRVIRLLLAGVDPSHILCLTYTKAAAKVMKLRIFERLASWATMPEPELASEIEAIEGRAVSPVELCLARQLFARAQDTPGGLKLQTIHAFCEALLHQFCLEGGMPYHFTLMDNAQIEDSRKLAKQIVMRAASQDGTTDCAIALRHILCELGLSSLDKMLEKAAQDYNELMPTFRKAQQKGVPLFFSQYFGDKYFGDIGKETLLQKIDSISANDIVIAALQNSKKSTLQKLATGL